jgi:hypothetical protein
MSNNVNKTDYGYNISWANTDNYSASIMVFDNPSKTNLEFHKTKQKTWFVNNGLFKIRWIDTNDGKLYEKEVKEGSVFHVEPLMPVSLESIIPGSSITEVSTPSKDKPLCVIPAANIGG